MHVDAIATVDERRRNPAGQVVGHTIAVDLGHEVAQVLATPSLVRIDSYIADNSRRDLVQLVVAVAPLVGRLVRFLDSQPFLVARKRPETLLEASALAALPLLHPKPHGGLFGRQDAA
ncbi:Uncharacterised protein [Burkholderia pseudomallei]|nr:Uncharacterised protein [Burkholderia pseudomallei]